MSMNKLRSQLWTLLTNLYPTYLRMVYKMPLGGGVRIAQKAHLDKSTQKVSTLEIEHGY